MTSTGLPVPSAEFPVVDDAPASPVFALIAATIAMVVLGTAGTAPMLTALAALLGGSLAVRLAIVKLPHATH